jgi:hypothetical protein
LLLSFRPLQLTVRSSVRSDEQELTLIPVQLITQENVSDYKGWTK